MFGPFLDAQKLAEAQNRSKMHVLFMLYPVEAVTGLSSGKIMDFLTEEGSNFDDSSPRTSV